MAKSIKLRNPLAVCWGLVLRNTRESRSWEYADIERMSGLTQDFYRNIEKAIFNLHVSQAIPLYNTFRNDVIGETFSLDGIIQILSAISIMEVRANEKARKYKNIKAEEEAVYYSALRDCAVEIAQNSKKFGRLFSKFFETNIFSLNNDTDSVIETIEENGLLFELEDFLTHYYDYGADEANEGFSVSYNHFFDNVPSIYTDFISETKKNLLGLPVKMIFSELQTWEKINESKLEELYVLISKKFDVAELDNLENYHYTYLFKNNFKRARFLVVQKNLSAPDIKQKFDENLHTAYKNKKIKVPKNWDKGLSKIQFKVLANLPEELEQILLLNDGLKNDTQFECFWVFKFVDGTLVGFVANAVEAPDFHKTGRYIFYEGKSLFIKEILERYPILKKHFNS